MLLSDGEPTDDFDSGLAKLQENNWFKHAIKIAIAIGDDANKEKLAQFTGTSEAVFPVHNIDALKKMIRIVAVTSSQVGSQSSSVGDENKQGRTIDLIKDEINNSPAPAEPKDVWDKW